MVRLWSGVSPRRRTRNVVLIMLALAMLSAGTVWGVSYLNELTSRCGTPSALTEVRRFMDSEECVGFTDGSRPFEVSDALTDIQKKIKAENDKAGDKTPLNVVIALALPYGGQGGVTPTSAADQLTAAHWAQLEANRRGNDVWFRLLIANIGHDSVAWEPVSKQLIELRHRKELVLVTGLGQSKEGTERFASALAAAEIPMMATLLTADRQVGLDAAPGDRFPGIHRIAPTNRYQVQVALEFMRTRPDKAHDGWEPRPVTRANTVLAVVDDPKHPDPYVQSLRADFNSLVAGADSPPAEIYLKLVTSPETPGKVLNLISEDIADRVLAYCPNGSVDTIYLAARAKYVRKFVNKLDERCSPDRPITLITGDDATDLVNLPVEDAEDKDGEALTAALSREKPGVQLYYTGLAHSRQWAGRPEASDVQERIDALTKENDGRAPSGTQMMSYDTHTIAFRVALKALTKRKDPHQPPMEYLSIQDSSVLPFDIPFCGTVGPVRFASEAKAPVYEGDAIRRAVPVIRAVVGSEPAVYPLFPTEEVKQEALADLKDDCAPTGGPA
ncbi:hypothetical protein Cs7R123_46500 [Catellatospora sp. TT07R-123]|uniref:hypothetical protein n=1 Tax=Catellatospora sp. TT07R-123 TaxID=2733863 RepID=UPI001B01C55D|nr:hypothetical protein [Catellatospora sp. TT07R-123]GHJ47308.1 hypothetical protein Cs7R123_46500 [Catellatospora sp. TT07R-123]